MVLYTNEARDGAGGELGLRALVNYALKEANEAFANSAIESRIRLVHFGPTNESEVGSTRGELDRLQDPADGNYDQAHMLRDTYGADLVSLILNIPDSSGIGRAVQRSLIVPADDQIAFSVVQRNSLVGTHTLTHELGHNLGANHAITDQSLPGAFEYSNAHQFRVNNQSYRTIMARQFGIQLPYFSNPDVFFDGEPTGSPESDSDPANNALTINQTAPEVAQFRPEIASNDAFEDAIQLEGLWAFGAGSNLRATAEANEPSHTGSPPAHSIWWQWQAPLTGTIELLTDGTAFDHRVAIYQGATLDSLQSQIERTINLSDSTDAIEFPVTAGVTYSIAIDSVGDLRGFASLQLQQDNDLFENRTPIRGAQVTAVAHNGSASTEVREPNHGFFNTFTRGPRNTVWWEWEAPASGPVTINSRGTSLVAALGVYQGADVQRLELVAESSIRFPPERWREVQFDADEGERYAIAIGATAGLGSSTGLVVINLSQTRTRSLRIADINRLTDAAINLSLDGFFDSEFEIEQSFNLDTWTPILSVDHLDGPQDVELQVPVESSQVFYRLAAQDPSQEP